MNYNQYLSRCAEFFDIANKSDKEKVICKGVTITDAIAITGSTVNEAKSKIDDWI